MLQTVLVTGTGRPYALGFNLVKRYLEAGDRVFASIRRPSEALEALQKEYPDQLHILTMDISSTESVQAAAAEAAKQTLHIKKTAGLPAVFLMRFLSRHPDLIQAVTQDIVDLYLLVQPRMFLDPFVVL